MDLPLLLNLSFHETKTRKQRYLHDLGLLTAARVKGMNTNLQNRHLVFSFSET